MKFLRALLLLLFTITGLSAQSAPPFEDSMAQRSLACTGCHGAQGRAGPDGYYPRIAGKPASYLYHQLLHFREGRRHYGLMTQLLDPLSDDYLMDIATHFASLDLPYPAPAPASGTPAQWRRGQQLALAGDPIQRLPACAQCHGKALTGVLPATPGLLGLSRDYLNGQLGAWRSGQRRAHAPDCMADIARALTPEDLQAVVAWLSAQPWPAQGRPLARLPQASPMACGSAPRPAGSARP